MLLCEVTDVLGDCKLAEKMHFILFPTINGIHL